MIWPGSVRFYGSVALCYADLDRAKEWWIRTFDCKQVEVPSDWDDPLPSDVALLLPGDDQPTILLGLCREGEQAGFDRSSSVVPIVFTNNVKKARERLSGRGVLTGAIQSDGETEFFEIPDIEGNVIEICKEP